MKLRSFLCALAVTCGALFAHDSSLDLRIDADPTNLGGSGSMNVTTTNVAEFGNHSLLFTPEMSFYANGGIDFSVSAGHRHTFWGATFGHHVFFDRSNQGLMTFDQIGTGLDVLTARWDLRANYYEPYYKRARYYGPFYSVTSSKWADAEIFFKTRFFGVGTGPLYNIDEKHWGLHSRLIIPMNHCSVSIGAICGQSDHAQGCVSVSFHLFKPKVCSPLVIPGSHVQKSNVYYIFADKEKDPAKRARDEVMRPHFNPNMVRYVEQTEDSITLRDKGQHKEDGEKK